MRVLALVLCNTIIISLSAILLKRDSVCILINIAGKDHNSLDKTPDIACSAAEAQTYLCNALAGIAQIKVVNAKTSEQHAKQTRRHFGFLLIRCVLRQRSAAIGAECRARLCLCSAVGAIRGPLSF